MSPRTVFGALAVSAVALAGIACAQADSFPDKPVTVVVGFAAGGGTDIYARALSSHAQKYLNGQPIVVVNKPGGAGIPAGKMVADSRKDGYTVYLASAGAMYFAWKLQSGILDPNKELEMVSMVGRLLPALMVHKDSPYKTTADLVNAIKTQPGVLRYSTPGTGSTWGTAGLAFNLRNGLNSQPVPFQGGSKARAALIGKQVDYAVNGVHLLTGFEDQIRVLGLIFPERDPYNPDVPTLKEQNVAFTEVLAPMMVFAPKGTPPDRIKVLDQAFAKISEEPDYKQTMRKANLPVKYMSAKEAADYYAYLQKEWAPLVDEVKKSKPKS